MLSLIARIVHLNDETSPQKTQSEQPVRRILSTIGCI